MKTTRIHIKNLFGISETELDGRSIEVTGSNGVGKTSIIDSIKYALTNDSSRDYVIKNGESEGEIFIETDTGLTARSVSIRQTTRTLDRTANLFKAPKHLSESCSRHCRLTLLSLHRCQGRSRTELFLTSLSSIGI